MPLNKPNNYYLVDALYHLSVSHSCITDHVGLDNCLTTKYEELVTELIQTAFLGEYKLSEEEIRLYTLLLKTSATTDVRNYKVSIICALQTIERMVGATTPTIQLEEPITTLDII